MLLLFGVLSSRKGVQQVLDAMRLLPADQLRSVTLCLVGPVHASAKHLITNAQAVLGNRLKVLDNFVSEADVQSYFAAADIVLAPYPRHVGMSAVIIRAAAAEKPVVASAFGLMGALVKAHRLGLAVDAREPAAIAEAILEIKQHAGTLTSTAEMKNLAQAHRTEHFAQAILERTLTPSSRN
jgi:glycosyltransferase involved in cell wall biosynthesis